jgi:hypothetical protein
MPERSLTLLAAGTKHTVWRICEADGSPSGRIIRIPKQAGSETPTEGESSFVQTVLAPLLGSQFVHPSLARLSFPEWLVREFDDAAQRGEGVSAAEASEVIAAADAASGGARRPPGTEVLVETDHTVLRLCAASEPCASTATAAAAPACTPALCLELKPKAGVLASGPLGEAAWSQWRPGGATARSHGLLGQTCPRARPGVSYSPRTLGATGEARPGCCRYCLHVRSKTVGSAPTEYCPLDLYSAEAPRMSRALRALLLTPLNNMRIFSREGACTYGGRGGLGSRGLLRRVLLRELSVTARPAAKRRVAAASAPSGGGHGVESGEEGGRERGEDGGEDGGEEDGGEEEGERAEALMVEVVVRVLLHEPLLSRLRAVHAHDVRGSAAAAEAHSRALAALGAEALSARLARWPPCADGATGQEVEAGGAGAVVAMAVAVTASAAAGAVAEGSERPTERAAAGGAVEACSDGATQVAEEVAQLRAWLTALTAADVSLMLALRRAPAEDGLPSHVQPSGGLSPGRVHAAGGEAFLYRLAVVDVQPKPLSKVAAHAELDRRIAEMPPLASTCTERDGSGARSCGDADG